MIPSLAGFVLAPFPQYQTHAGIYTLLDLLVHLDLENSWISIKPDTWIYTLLDLLVHLDLENSWISIIPETMIYILYSGRYPNMHLVHLDLENAFEKKPFEDINGF